MAVSERTLEEMYWERGMNQVEIAERIGVHQTRVSELMRDLGIETRAGGGKSPIPRADLLNDVRRVARELGRRPTSKEYEELGEHARVTLANRFGSWVEARRLALE